ncbi:MAG: MBL fold metallo-hydrolase [Acidimicrobiales bacterium]
MARPQPHALRWCEQVTVKRQCGEFTFAGPGNSSIGRLRSVGSSSRYHFPKMDRSEYSNHWRIGDIVVTSVVEQSFDWSAPGFLFPDATNEVVQRHRWLVPDYADSEGNINGSVQALVIDQAERRILVDPCVGNGRSRFLPNWHMQEFDFMDRFAGAGFTPESVDIVLHTHLHADHVGWDTYLQDGVWTPTFPAARYVYVRDELEWHKESWDPDRREVWQDAISPVFDAGLADVVECDHDVGGGISLAPSPGHTGGHVSVWLRSHGQVGLVTGDFMHHPLQFAEPGLREIADDNVELARGTRRSMISQASQLHALLIGTHFAFRSGGRVVPSGEGWQFNPD